MMETSSSFDSMKSLLNLNNADSVVNELPCFSVDGESVTTINDPNKFYTDITVCCNLLTFSQLLSIVQTLTKTSKRRILIATLYIGNGELETKLVRFNNFYKV
jgi:hypothetical protein